MADLAPVQWKLILPSLWNASDAKATQATTQMPGSQVTGYWAALKCVSTAHTKRAALLKGFMLAACVTKIQLCGQQ